jgi:hypothetical protein
LKSEGATPFFASPKSQSPDLPNLAQRLSRFCMLYFTKRISKETLNCLKYRQHLIQGFDMKKPSIFPSLPKNLTDRELRKEIRRRLKISDQLGLIRKPKK